MRLVVVGAPGAGKSTVGRRLAQHWGVPFCDSDAIIEDDAGISVSDIFIEMGEPEFRRRERDVIATQVASLEGVLAVGGGAVLDDGTRRLLGDVPCLWLRVGASDAARRVGLTASRPLLLGNVRGTLITLLDERTPLYEEVATWAVDTDGATIDEVVARAISAVEGDA